MNHPNQDEIKYSDALDHSNNHVELHTLYHMSIS